MPKAVKPPAESKLIHWLKIIGAGCAAILALAGVASLVMTGGAYITKINNHEAAITAALPRLDALEKASSIHELDKRIAVLEERTKNSSSPIITPPTLRPTAGKQR